MTTFLLSCCGYEREQKRSYSSRYEGQYWKLSLMYICHVELQFLTKLGLYVLFQTPASPRMSEDAQLGKFIMKLWCFSCMWTVLFHILLLLLTSEQNNFKVKYKDKTISSRFWRFSYKSQYPGWRFTGGNMIYVSMPSLFLAVWNS
jgi:uncharacterized membrane protein